MRAVDARREGGRLARAIKTEKERWSYKRGGDVMEKWVGGEGGHEAHLRVSRAT